MDDEDEYTDTVEWVCEHCAGRGCGKCDSDITLARLAELRPAADGATAFAAHTAAAMDAILSGRPIGGDAA